MIAGLMLLDAQSACWTSAVEMWLAALAISHHQYEVPVVLDLSLHAIEHKLKPYRVSEGTMGSCSGSRVGNNYGSAQPVAAPAQMQYADVNSDYRRSDCGAAHAALLTS